jgi:leader peptidase (prepilin peptidase)/N-methyltransferase
MVLALLFGSFLNVCIARLPRHHSIVRPGSHCPQCEAPIRPWDNIPILSWLLLRGRCRACRRPIPARYPLVEAGYPALVAVCIVRFGFTAEGLAAAVFCFLALGLLVMDLETMRLPDAFTLTGLALGLLWAFAAPSFAVSELFGGLRVALTAESISLGVVALGVAALFAFLWAALLLAIRWGYHALRHREGLGLGDVKLVAMLAAWLGLSRTALCFLVAVVGAAIAGLAALSGRAFLRPQPRQPIDDPESPPATWGTLRIPLGAFLCASGLYSLFFGEQTLRWYFSLFGLN